MSNRDADMSPCTGYKLVTKAEAKRRASQVQARNNKLWVDKSAYEVDNKLV